MKKPNILICMCDQLRAAETGCYGNEVIRTPNVDALASEGVRFVHGITNSPVCMAARSVLVSGQHNRTCTGGIANAVSDGQLPEYPITGRPHIKDESLAECLRDAGYRTAAIGKWHIHSWPKDVGFEYSLIPRVHHCHAGQNYSENGGPEFVPEGFSVDFEAGRAAEFLQRQAKGEEPFFLLYNISPPHCPVADAPEKYLKMYDPQSIPLRPNVDVAMELRDQNGWGNNDLWFKIYRWDYKYYMFHLPYTDKLPERYGLRELIAEYYGATTWMDEAFGRVLKALEDAGVKDDTIVIFVSDHGDSLGSHGLAQKMNPMEESINIPCIIRWPGKIEKGVDSTTVAGLVDVMPTMLGLAGVPVPAAVQGKDLSGLLTGKTPAEGENCAFVEIAMNSISVRTPTHMCQVEFEGTPRKLKEFATRFHNLAKDPYEMANLAGTGTEREVEEELIEKIRAFDRRTPFLRDTPAGEGGLNRR